MKVIDARNVLTTFSEEYKKSHYGGMELVTSPADASLHRRYAQEWLECNSKSSRENHFKEHNKCTKIIIKYK
jgi:hypothetical protein